MSLNKEQLEKLVEDALFGQPPSTQAIVMWTGHGGCKDYVKAFYELINPNKPYTWRKMRHTYNFLVATGSIKRVGRGYKIS